LRLQCTVYTGDSMRCKPRSFTVAALFVLSACRQQPSPTVFVDPALATLVPADTVFITGIRVQQLRSTPVYQRYVLGRKLPVVENFARDTGIDPRKDLWEVLIPSDGKATWVMLRGKFTEMGMEPRINREDVQRMRYKGYSMLGDERMAVMFLNPTTAVAASTAGLRRIVDNRDKGTGIPAWLYDRVKSIPSSNQVWFAGNPGELKPWILANMVTGAVDFHRGINARVDATAGSDQDAQRVTSALRELRAPGLDVRSNGSKVEVEIHASADRLDEFMRRLITVSEQGWRRPD
jgi:hypothetical protein